MTIEQRAQADLIYKAAQRFQSSPFPYIEEVLGVDQLEDYQRDCMQAIWDNDRVAIKACHDLGKTFIMSRIAMTFFNVFPYSKVITTAPTFLQVEKIMWSEIRSAHKKAKWPLGGTLNMTDWTFSPDWFMLGFTPRNESSGGEGQGTQSSFQGFHAPYLLVVFDEATGIPPNVWVQVEGLLTSAHVKFVAIGNPTSEDSDFAKCFKSPLWTKISLTCFHSPNLIANGITDKKKLKAEIEKVKRMPEEEAREYLKTYKVVRPYLLTLKWVVENVMKWGFDHPLTLSKVFGEFPKAGAHTLISLNSVEASQNRSAIPTPHCRKVIGVDVARYGNDSSVLTGLHGMLQTHMQECHKFDTVAVVGEVINLSREMGNADVIVVDETGLGGGVVDLLRDEVGKSLPKNIEIRGVQFGASCEDSEDKKMYHDMKARMYGLLADDMKKDNGLALLNESIYAEELPTIRKKYNRKGQMVIESKDDFKKRTGRKSPDHADSLALANFGHYDELKIGKWSDIKTSTTNFATNSTRAGGLNSKREY